MLDEADCFDIPVDGDMRSLEDILVDTKYHCREGLKDHMVARYEAVYRAEMRDGIEESRMPPLEVALINVVCVLFDGFHRYRAMRNCGMLGAAVVVHHGRTYKELPYLAAQINLNHGIYMSNKDVRKIAFSSYVKSKSNRVGKGYKSYREIALDFNLAYSHNTFRNWMKKDFPAVFKAMADDEDGEIEFEALDPDMAHIEAAKEDLSRITNRFKSIRSDGAKVELWNAFVEFYGETYRRLPQECEAYQNFQEVTSLVSKVVEDDDF